MPQKPVCLFWSSPRWYICLRVIAILNTEIKCYQQTFILPSINELFFETYRFFLLTIMSIVWRSRLSRARMSLSVTFLYRGKMHRAYQPRKQAINNLMYKPHRTPYLRKQDMYVYGQLTAPNPDNKAMSVTPITPTRLISCSMERMPEERKKKE